MHGFDGCGAETNATDTVTIDFNCKTNAWEAGVGGARPGATDYAISVSESGKLRPRFTDPGRTKVEYDGEFEFMGHDYHQSVMVWVERRKFGQTAYDKIHSLLKEKEPCRLTIKRGLLDRFSLVGADFYTKGKTYEMAKDGKVREVFRKRR